MTYRAAILLSAFGDSDFFAEQVESIVGQMNEEDILLIVDDGSRMVPWQSVVRWPKNYKVWSRLQGMGVSYSFLDLIFNTEINAEHYFLSDQDDIWIPGKISAQVQIQARSNIEPLASTHAWKNFGVSAEPPLADAVFHPLQNLSLAHYCFETPAPGMTMSFNHLCRELLFSHQAEIMRIAEYLPHDRLLFALLSATGRLYIHPEVFVCYRQHSKNLVGAPGNTFSSVLFKRLTKPLRAWNTVVFGLVLHAYVEKNKQLSHINAGHVPQGRLRSSSLDDFLFRTALYLRVAYLRLIKRTSNVAVQKD